MKKGFEILIKMVESNLDNDLNVLYVDNKIKFETYIKPEDLLIAYDGSWIAFDDGKSDFSIEIDDYHIKTDEINTFSVVGDSYTLDLIFVEKK